MATITLFKFSAGQNEPLISPASSNESPKLTSLSLSSSPITFPSILAQIKRLEKRTFPKEEAMDFDVELKKRNTELIVLLDTSPPADFLAAATAEANRKPARSLLSIETHHGKGKSSPEPESEASSAHEPSALIVAYILHARSSGASLLHKVCVAEKYRRRGLAQELLKSLKSKLETQGCEKIQLWVDWQREGAIQLYKTLDFRRVDGARDYYGSGRHGIKMACDLNWVW
jgi:ribosomal protein S18 acetylase RimI-like enzyme